MSRIRGGDAFEIRIVGLSMLSMGGGGTGTWSIVRSPDRFAASVLTASVKPGDDLQHANLFGTPTWAFHARNDSVIPEDRTREVINGFLSAANMESVEFPANNDRTDFEYYGNDVKASV